MTPDTCKMCTCPKNVIAHAKMLRTNILQPRRLITIQSMPHVFCTLLLSLKNFSTMFITSSVHFSPTSAIYQATHVSLLAFLGSDTKHASQEHVPLSFYRESKLPLNPTQPDMLAREQ